MRSLKITGSYVINQGNIDAHAMTALEWFKVRKGNPGVREHARSEAYKARQCQWHSVTQLGSQHPQYDAIKRKYLAAEARRATYGWDRQDRIGRSIIQLSALGFAEHYVRKMRLAAKGHTARLSIGKGRFEVTTRLMKNGRLRTYFRSNYWSGCHLADSLDNQCEDLFACSIMAAIGDYRKDYLKRVN